MDCARKIRSNRLNGYLNALRMNTANFKAIIDHAIDGIVITDIDGKILLTNLSANQMFGYNPDELCGKVLHKFFSPISLTQIADSSQLELEACRRDQTTFPVRVATCSAEGDGIAVLANFIQDISNEKITEQHLHQQACHLEEIVKERTDSLKALIKQLELTQEETRELLQKEREIGQMKSRFVSVASHEFRSPLSRIQLSASIIERFYERLDRSKIIDHLQKIKGAVAELTNTLDDFLSVEKIDSGRIKPNITAFDLKVFVEDVCEEMSFLKRARQRIRCHHSGDMDVFTLDKSLLKHCLANLLSNACKYSGDDGFIEVKTDVADNKIVITVADNGIGIPPEDRDRLFEAFFRAGNARDFTGTGLGLNIVKSYAELMGGQVIYEPAIPHGCQFHLYFNA